MDILDAIAQAILVSFVLFSLFDYFREGTLPKPVLNVIIILAFYLSVRFLFKKITSSAHHDYKITVNGVLVSGGEEKFSLSFGDVMETNVAGVSFDDHQIIIRSLSADDNVKLIRDKANSHDENAIAVYAKKRNGDSYQSIGFLPKQLSKKIVELTEFDSISGISIKSVYKVPNGDLSGVKIRFALLKENIN